MADIESAVGVIVSEVIKEAKEYGYDSGTDYGSTLCCPEQREVTRRIMAALQAYHSSQSELKSSYTTSGPGIGMSLVATN